MSSSIVGRCHAFIGSIPPLSLARVRAISRKRGCWGMTMRFSDRTRDPWESFRRTLTCFIHSLLQLSYPQSASMVRKTSSGLFASVHQDIPHHISRGYGRPPAETLVTSGPPQQPYIVLASCTPVTNSCSIEVDLEQPSCAGDEAPTKSFSPGDYTKPYLEFMTNNPTVFHAVDRFTSQLKDAGYEHLCMRRQQLAEEFLLRNLWPADELHALVQVFHQRWQLHQELLAEGR